MYAKVEAVTRDTFRYHQKIENLMITAGYLLYGSGPMVVKKNPYLKKKITEQQMTANTVLTVHRHFSKITFLYNL